MQCDRCYCYYEPEVDEHGNQLEGCPNDCADTPPEQRIRAEQEAHAAKPKKRTKKKG